MTLFFFHFSDEASDVTSEGFDFNSHDAMKRVAMLTAASMLKEYDEGNQWQMAVFDVFGRNVLTITFAVEVKPP